MTSEQPEPGESTSTEADMPQLLIIGGGFAGVWAALAAAQTAATHGDVRIDLINPIDDFVPRPRLYESAPGEKTLPLADILTPHNVGHIRAKATDIDVDAKSVTLVDDRGDDRLVPYDRVILASGSRLSRPPIDDTHLDNIDTLAAAEALDERLGRLRAGATIAVIGAGFTGIELASELPARAPSADVVLVDRSDQLGSQLGPGPRPAIEAALEALRVDTRTGVTVTAYDGSNLELSDGQSLSADIVVWTAGMSASPLTAAISDDLDPLGRLAVDQFLRVRDAASVFAAGDTAAPLDGSGHVVAQSAQHAIPQGACAGSNAVADLFGAELTELQTLPYGTCLDLGSAGAVFTEGWDRRVTLVGEDAKALKRAINTEWIYPPR